MLEIMPGVMAVVPLAFIRAWSRATWLYAAAYDEGLVDYLETRNLKEWEKHREATVRGDAVVDLRGAVRTAEENRAAEARALAAAQECRTFSTRHQAKRVFKKWKEKRAQGEKDGEGSEGRELFVALCACVCVYVCIYLCVRVWWCFIAQST